MLNKQDQFGGTSASIVRWNTVSNYVGLVYNAGLSILIIPVYLAYLGAEAFGLVGLFIVLQALLQVFDLGMSPLIVREVSQLKGGADRKKEILEVIRSIEFVAWTLCGLLAVVVWAFSSSLALIWLNPSMIPLQTIEDCLLLMGLAIAMRIATSVYRSGVQGAEKQIILNVIGVAFTTLRFGGALVLLEQVSNSILVFFFYQLLVTALELMVLSKVFHAVLPKNDQVPVGFFWDSFRVSLPFAGGIAFTSLVWIMVTQTDKFVLSKTMTLTEYGYFTFVVVVTTGMIQVSNPISQALLPRMTALLSKGRTSEMLSLYRSATQVMAVLLIPLAGLISAFPGAVVYVWTGQIDAAIWSKDVLRWFALGNGFLVLGAFQYYLQFAYGRVRLHVIYNSIVAFVQIPIIIFVAVEYGAIGVGITWFVLRAVSFAFWTPFVHSKFAPGLHWKWISADVLPTMVTTLLCLLFFKLVGLDWQEESRLVSFVFLAVSGLVTFTCCLLVSDVCRQFVISQFRPRLSIAR